jgi:spore coat polysaccharide biosynthesis protein SpsF
MKQPKIVAIIQGRMTSSRLPGKILMDIGGQPNLLWMVRRTSRAQRIDQVVIATTDDPSDDPVAEFCTQHEIECFRGSMHDVLDRYYQAARYYGADVVVRLTGDCPFIDPDLLDSNITTFLTYQPPLDFAANRLPGNRTVPIGLDTEVCTIAALTRAWHEATAEHQREHVMPYLYEVPGRFEVLHILHHPDYGGYRWTLDMAQDLVLLREIAAHFPDDAFSWTEVIDLMERRPELAAINARVQHRTQYDVDDRR